ncbi:Lysophosphatidylcholine acyltransferase 2 [Tritrichomonas musculus]|uniref:Lysophosphatidylcholine acyltransferase 2 n=1 Tax=Tritrichomonas musculus TaxID=1915356 RepID=A0ABR2JW98_9EUKA
MCTLLVPRRDERYKDQKELSKVTDEEFNENIIPTKATTKDRLIQLAFFIIFFGWLRLILILIISVIYVILMLPIILLCDKKSIVCHITPAGIVLTQFYLRVVYFLLGIYYVKTNGKYDPKARGLMFNHQTVLDGPLVYIYKPFRVIGMAELKKTPIFGPILESVDTIFVDRSKHEGTSKAITDYLNEPREVPLALAPEGRTTKGHFMLQFRTGSFIAKAPLQPVVIRYKQFLPYGQTGVVWLVGGMKEWLIRMLCMPGCFAEVSFLPVVDDEEFYSKTPAEKALVCNLIMANALCEKASDRSSRNMFNAKQKKE